MSEITRHKQISIQCPVSICRKNINVEQNNITLNGLLEV